ncbi:hypothetical protein B0A48_18359 [Cryoendolithus antarcticus]|uniref:Uncharacterized protein n=1 Tax=Cryoendolithus antarcticus TaxID=1507870 RepID=A0A1V8SAL9_9PEZI|nr:hypothetical protein B0A48_18359 [Cryoendolithus antarcticus]
MAFETTGESRAAEMVPKQASAREVTPWLQMTRWTSYLGSESINVFDQTRRTTWRRYIGVWKAPLCFTYRAQQGGGSISLRHRLTGQQLSTLDKAPRRANNWVQIVGAGHATGAQATAVAEQLNNALDDSCLDPWMSPLNHDLRGDLFESAVVGFLAVLVIDGNKGVIKDAYNYTPCLSGFIKISKMLVTQRAVAAAGEGILAQSSDLLDKMRARSIAHGTQSSFPLGQPIADVLQGVAGLDDMP